MALTTNLLSYWKFDGNTNDERAAANHGVLQGNTNFAAGKFGQAANFDGNADYIELNGFIGEMPANNMTVSMWVYADGGTLGTGRILLNWYADGQNRGLAYFWDSGGGVFKLATGAKIGGVWETNTSGNTTVTHGNWYHLAIVDNRGSLQFYVNGNAETMTNPTGATSPSNIGSLTTFWLGASNFGGTPQGDSWNGKIDDVAIWGRSLSASEIEGIYNCGAALLDTCTSVVDGSGFRITVV